MDEKSKDKDKGKSEKSSSVSVDSIILISLLAVLGVLLVVYFFNKKAPQRQSSSNPLKIQETPRASTSETGKPAAVVPSKVIPPTPSPKPIPHGPTDFFVSVGKEVKGPRMGKGTISPYDPEIGGKQQLTIAVSDTIPVTKVVAIIKTDKKTSEPHVLTLGTGTNLSGNWTGEWTVEDSYLYTYVLSIQATSPSGTSVVDVTLR